MGRTAKIERKTKETDISVTVNLDGSGKAEIETGMPFFNHMLDSFTRHGLFDITVKAKGDIAVDYHHTVEDVGLALGQAFKEALGDKQGIRRFGEASCPLDETLANIVVDLSGRPYLYYNVKIRPGRVGDFDTDLPHEFYAAFANQLGMNLHIDVAARRKSAPYYRSVFQSFRARHGYGDAIRSADSWNTVDKGKSFDQVTIQAQFKSFKYDCNY